MQERGGGVECREGVGEVFVEFKGGVSRDSEGYKVVLLMTFNLHN